MVTIGLSRAVPDIIGDFGRKSQNFPIPMYLTPSLMRLPLEFRTSGGVKNLQWYPTRISKSVPMCALVWT